MRLWSLHPRHLDAKGLVALWREGLLAQKALLGRTKGYRSHPQLDRFRECASPVRAIGCYLTEVLTEAELRGYRFDGTKIKKTGRCEKLKVTRGQITFEWEHLLRKLRTRDRKVWTANKALPRPKVNPLFRTVPGGVEDWERV